MLPKFPLEFIVPGTPISLQSSARSITAWKEAVRTAARPVLPEGHWLTDSAAALTIYYFPAEPMGGDIDNILKPILDALTGIVYFDDSQVERIVIQKFESFGLVDFDQPTEVLGNAIAGVRPRVRPRLYSRVSTDPFEDLRR